MRGDQLFRTHPDGFGTSEQIGLMPLKEREHGTEQRRIADPFAQTCGFDPGQIQKARGPPVIRKRPGQCTQRQRIIINCIPRYHRLSQSPAATRIIRVAKRVLVVEDNELNLKLFCDLLRAHGHETEGVRDAREAIERATLFAPEIIVMDIQMPHISGLELIEAIRRDVILRRTPIMAVTAYAAKGDEEQIRAAGADAYVSKPISLMRFIQVIGELGAIAESRALA
jgi:two-component system, cell cycle response regulator DivK